MGNGDRFVYVTFIRTTPEKLWEALTKPEFTRQYWYASSHESTWEQGAPWQLKAPDGRITDTGNVIEVDKPRRLVVSWRHQLIPDMKAEGEARATYDFEQQGEVVKLTVTHEIDKKASKLIQGVSRGWPSILSSLKSLLETGESIEETRRWPKAL